MTDNRPEEISIWMKSRRTWINIPIKDNTAFSVAWWSWWFALQPESRRVTSDGYMSRPAADMDWRKLNKLGKNGLPLVMITLTWWGEALSGGDEWKKAVVDVGAVIACLEQSGTISDVEPSNNALASSSTANATTGRPVRERKRVRPRDDGYEDVPKKKSRK